MPSLITPGLGLTDAGPIVIGTDPGGSELLRVSSARMGSAVIGTGATSTGAALEVQLAANYTIIARSDATHRMMLGHDGTKGKVGTLDAQSVDILVNNGVVATFAAGGSLAAAGPFGCNGATAQAKATLGAAASDAASTQTLANNIRTALINNGIGQT